MTIKYTFNNIVEHGYYLIPEFFLLGSAFMILVYVTLVAGRFMHYYYLHITIPFVQLVLLLTFILLLIMWYSDYLVFFFKISQEDDLVGAIQTVYLNNYLVHDQFVIFFKLLIIFLTLIVVFISVDYFKAHAIRVFEYSILILFATAGSLLLISSYDLIGFYLTMEFTSFCLYTLAASYYKSIYSVEAAIKYFVHGCCVSGIYVFGSALFFLGAGTTNFYSISALIFNITQNTKMTLPAVLFSDLSIFIVASVLTSILPLFKIGIVPYHNWVADVYEGSPMYVTAYFSIVTKLVMVIALIRFFFNVLPIFIFYLGEVFLFYGVISVIFGTLAAFSEQKIKRVLAYSSISHSGYIILGLAPYTFYGLSASLSYIIIYAITNIIIFTFLVTCLSAKQGEYRKYIIYVSDLCLLPRQNYTAAVCFSVALLSFAGLPPFAGFFVKLNIFIALWEAGHTVITVILVIMSLISTYYYLRFIKCLFFSPNNFEILPVCVSVANRGIMIFFTILLIFYPFYAIYLDFFLSHLLLNVFFCDF